MNTLRNTLVMALVCGLLSACGGGDADADEQAAAAAPMPCKYRTDCTAGPVGEAASAPERPASAASAP